MNEILSKYKMSDLVKILDVISVREDELNEAIAQTLLAKKNIKKILKEHTNEKTDITVYLPKETFYNINLGTKNKFNWKKVTLEILHSSPEPLTTLHFYENAKLKYPFELINKEKAIKGFSAALHYLKYEGKIMLDKRKNKNYYGLESKHFQKNNKGQNELS